METWFRIVYVKDGKLYKDMSIVENVSAALTLLDKYITFQIIEFSFYHI